MGKKIIVIIAIVVIALLALIAHYYGYTLQNLMEPEYKEVTRYSTGAEGYECSQPIQVKKQRIHVTHLSGSSWEFHYLPVDQHEADSFCHATWIE